MYTDREHKTTFYKQEDLLARIAERGFDHAIQSGDHVHDRGSDGAPATGIEAAVLIGLADYNGDLSVILTQRASHLRKHSGQIAFPGGKIDPQDISVSATALREAHEEIGLLQDKAEIIAEMPAYMTATGYRVRPILALLRPPLDLVANPDEVAQIFKVPFDFLMDARNHQLLSRQVNGRTRSYYAIDYQNHHIWGATAGIIRMLYERLYQ